MATGGQGNHGCYPTLGFCGIRPLLVVLAPVLSLVLSTKSRITPPYVYFKLVSGQPWLLPHPENALAGFIR
jgi:hypothetical protein